MVVLVLLMVAILLVAGAVVLYVAFPHRDEEVPGAPWLGEAVKRGVDTVGELLERPGEVIDERIAARSDDAGDRETSRR
ncbi:MAG TPA: hypothetical protein VHO29_14405 [Marmoricola sp.]|nr:hypothetical protein [Marmoricola sp.]